MSTNLRKPHWPEGVHVLGMEDLEKLGLGPDGHLYWDGHRLATAVRLTSWQNAGVILTVSSAVVLAAIEVLRFFGLGWG